MPLKDNSSCKNIKSKNVFLFHDMISAFLKLSWYFVKIVEKNNVNFQPIKLNLNTQYTKVFYFEFYLNSYKLNTLILY